MLAGLHAHQTAYTGDLICKAIPPDTRTIASELREADFNTLATVSNPHLSTDRNFDFGFDDYQNIRLRDSTSMVERRSADNKNEDQNTTAGVLSQLWDLSQSKLKEQNRYPNPYIIPYIANRYRQLGDWPTVDGADIRQEFATQLKAEADSESLTFGWCHFNDAHAPIHPRKTPKTHNVGGPIRQFAADSIRLSGIPHDRCSKMYDNALRYVDAQIERLFADLDDMGLLDNTAVIIVGDHGEELGTHGVYNHPWHYMYDVLLHVPLLIWTSDGVSETRLSSPFSLAWLHEVVAELTGEEFEQFSTRFNKDPFEDTYKGPAVSDTVTPNGYSIAVRDRDKKYLKYDISEVSYHTHIDVFRRDTFCLDLSDTSDEDRADLTPIEDDITELLEHYSIKPDHVPAITDDIPSDAEHRLRQLGYIN